jgi:hypothetical protein
LDTLGFPFPTHGDVFMFGRTHDVLERDLSKKNEKNIHHELKR